MKARREGRTRIDNAILSGDWVRVPGSELEAAALAFGWDEAYEVQDVNRYIFRPPKQPA